MEIYDEVERDLAGGGDVRNAQKKLKNSAHRGFSESYDGSLLVVFYAGEIIICGPNGLDKYIITRS